MRAAFKKTGDMSLEVFDGEANDEKENSIIENCIANGYDGIIVQANNGEAELPYIQQIVEARHSHVSQQTHVLSVKEQDL